MVSDSRPQIESFRLHAPLLRTGVRDHPMFDSDLLWCHLKIYAEGGENDLHAHPKEDHAFLVLEGSARFENGAGEELPVGKFDGVFVPRGALYRFTNSGEGNLVMLRIGAGSNSHAPGKGDERTGPDGQPMAFNPSQIARPRYEERPDWFGGSRR